MIQHLEILIDCLFFHSKNGNDDPAQYSFAQYYMPLIEIKDFDAWIDNKPFFWSASKRETRSVWKTCWNVKKRWLYNSKFIRIFVSLKIL